MKIAIVGSKPDTYTLVPQLGPEWEVWRFSRKGYNSPPAFHRWFELHDKKHFPRYEVVFPGYTKFLQTDKRVVLQQHYPTRIVLDQFGPYFFSGGQAPWIMAYAIMFEPETIGLWGIDPVGDYKPQRSEVQHFIQMARDRGIEVIAPEDDILGARKLYAFETDPMTEYVSQMGFTPERVAEMFANPPKVS